MSRRAPGDLSMPVVGLLDEAFDALVVPAAVCETGGRFVAVNRAAAELLGRSAEDLRGRTFRDVTHPGDAAADAAATARLEAGDASVVVRKRFVRADGVAVAVEATLVALRDGDGDWVATLAQYRPAPGLLDHTARALFVALPVGVAVFDLDHRFLAVNPAMAAINHRSVEEHLGRRVDEILAPASAAAVAAILTDVARTGRPVTDVRQSGAPRARPGTTIHTSASWVPIVDDAGAVVATAAVVVDRTAEVRAAAAEEERRAALDALVAALPLPVTLLSPDGRYLHVNEATRALAGVAPEEHLGRTVHEVYPPRVRDLIAGLMADPPAVRSVDLADAGRSRRSLRITGFPVPGTGWGFAVEDHTELRAAQRRVAGLAALATRLASSATLTDVAAAVDDAVRAELGAVGAAVALIETGGPRVLTPPGAAAGGAPAWAHLGPGASPAADAHRRSAPLWFPDPATLAARYPGAGDDAPGRPPGALAALPLVASGERLGVLAITWPDRHDLALVERQWCETVANLLASALHRARRGEQDRHAAEVLQQSLLPRRLQPPAWLRAGAAYRAAGSGSAGGDVYDLVPLPSGGVAVVVADVCGRGVDAAAGTALVRHTLRAALLRGDPPAAALAAVDHALAVDGRPVPLLATALVAALAPPAPDGRTTCEITLAGHPRPVLRRTGGATEILGTPALLLGLADPAPARPAVHVTVAPGDVLVAYTDGLTDTPDPRLDDEQVATLVRVAPVPVEELAAWLLGATESTRASADDTAVLAVALV